MRRFLSHILENETVYRLWQRPQLERKLAPFRRHNDPSAARRVLDVGCGPGTNTALFAGAEYLGIDSDPRYVAAARRRFGRDFEVMDARLGVPERWGSFDLILANSVFHHLDDDGTRLALRRLGERLSPDGHIHVIDLVLPPERGLPRFLARMDRGDHPRPLAAWRDLFSEHLGTVVFEPFGVSFARVAFWELVYFKGRRRTPATGS